jgi:hypothetical protein
MASLRVGFDGRIWLGNPGCLSPPGNRQEKHPDGTA